MSKLPSYSFLKMKYIISTSLKQIVFLTMKLHFIEETIVRGYRIPTGTITLPNFWSAHHDENTFEDPYTFEPSRYLHSEGKPKVESPVIFGMGKYIVLTYIHVILTHSNKVEYCLFFRFVCPSIRLFTF